MQRDFDLIRKILLEIEKMPAGSGSITIHSVDGDFSSEEITQHLSLLLDAGLIVADEIRTYDGVTHSIQSMTWNGHDYLDSVRSEDIWSKVQDKLGKIGGTAALEIVKYLAMKTAKELLN